MSELPFRVLLVTDDDACARAGHTVIETVARALLPKVDGVAVLVRMKGASERDVAERCVAVRAIARRSEALVLVHGHPRLVARLGLDGAHVDSRAHVDEARVALPPRALLGASRHSDDLEHRARFFGLDYATMSPVFAPSSKPDDRATLGLDRLRDATARAPIPLAALGGVDDRNARACLAHGAHAAAVVGAVMSARDPRRALLALCIAAAGAPR
jgi:thiamine-phosphate pyrophosphorylase